MLLHDVAISLWGGYLKDGSIVPAPARTEFQKSPETWIATTCPLDGRKLHISWPTPVWTTFRQVECFNSIWRLLSEGQPEHNLGSCWLESILRVANNDPILTATGRRGWSYIYETVKKLIKEKPEREIRRQLRWTTLAAIATVCAPEFRAFESVEVETLLEKCKGLGTEFKRIPVANYVRVCSRWNQATLILACQQWPSSIYCTATRLSIP